jgi:hypothetical protein
MLHFSSKRQYNHFYKNNPEYMKDEKDLFYSDIIIANSSKVNNRWNHPYIPGYETIPVLMKSTSKWGLIGPYELKTEGGVIFENFWQFSKVYKETPNVKINQYGTVIWEYPNTHFFNENETNPNEEYWKWRYNGFKCEKAIRYPVYKTNSHTCLYCIPETDKTEKLGYIDARREVYFKNYADLVKKEPLFHKLKTMLNNGKKIILTEVDGMNKHRASYYKKKYNHFKNEPLEMGTINVTKLNIYTMANDSSNAVGHVYPLAIALKEWDVDQICLGNF